MGDERPAEPGPERDAVTVTMRVLPEPGRRAGAHARARPARAPRGALAIVLLAVVAVAAGSAGLLASSGPARTPSPARSSPPPAPSSARSPLPPAPAPPARIAVVDRRLGIPLRCPRLVIIAPGGRFARVDLDRFGPCGSYGNFVTIVLQRVHGAWSRALQVTAWTCRTPTLPPSVLRELGLCS